MQNPIVRILPFGTGSALSDLLGILPQNVTVVGLCDNDPRKQGTEILGHPCLLSGFARRTPLRLRGRDRPEW